MVTLALASRDIVRGIYNFSIATSHPQKVQEMEAIILGVVKVCAIFCTFSALYAAYFLIERRDLQLLLVSLTFCIHPVAALDISGITVGAYGIIKCQISKSLNVENINFIEKLTALAKEQTEKEGYRFYAFPRSFFGNGPPETMKRFKELVQELGVKHFGSNYRDQLNASVNTAAEPFIAGLSYLGISTLNGIGIAYTHWASVSFWLDRKMVDFSKWLAPQIV